MGLLGSIRKKVHAPLRLRMKRKRTGGGEPLKFASTSEFTEEESIDSSLHQYNNETTSATTKRLLKMEKAASEDTQELLSPHGGNETSDTDGSFVFDPIMVSDDDDTTDDEKPQRRDEVMEPMEVDEDVAMSENDKSLLDDDEDETMYVSDDSAGDREFPSEQQQQQQPPPHHACQVSLIRTHTPPNPSHSRIRSEGQHQHVFPYIFHDELATLYEEPNKSCDTLDSSSSAKSTSSNSTVENRVVPLRDTLLDESNIRARWEYALQLMVGNCEPSEILYDTIATMASSIITNGDDIMEVAEI